MPWFKVDDGFHGHPKVVELSLESVGLWTLAGSWCASYLTDGEINLKSVRRIGGDQPQVDELVDAGLWLDLGGNTYQFKDWADYQPLKSAVEAERDAARERMQKVRSKKKGTAPPSSEDVRPNNTGTFARTSEEVRVTPSQSHPIPSPTPNGVDTRGTNTAGKTGSRLPANWNTTPEHIAWALEHTPNIDIKTSTQKFKAHYRSVAGKQQFKTDWDEAWRAWALGDQERATPRQQFQTAAERKLDAGAQLIAKYSQLESNQLQLGETL